MGALWNSWRRSPLIRLPGSRAHPGAQGLQIAARLILIFSTGGGVRYYVADNWGIWPEVRVFISGRNFTRISVGVFYDIDADWPFRIRRRSIISRHWRHRGQVDRLRRLVSRPPLFATAEVK